MAKLTVTHILTLCDVSSLTSLRYLRKTCAVLVGNFYLSVSLQCFDSQPDSRVRAPFPSHISFLPSFCFSSIPHNLSVSKRPPLPFQCQKRAVSGGGRRHSVSLVFRT